VAANLATKVDSAKIQAFVWIPFLKHPGVAWLRPMIQALSMPEDSPMDLLRVGIDPNWPTMVHS